MANMTLSIPSEIYARMLLHPEYRWSELARQAIAQKLDEAELVADLKAISKAETERKAGKTISHKKLLKRLGLENDL